MTLFDLFDKTLIINLPERIDRLRDTELELKYAGSAVDGVKIEVFRAVRPQRPDGFPSIGAHGSLVSHLEALNLLYESGAQTGLLLEDDVSFTPFTRDESALSALRDVIETKH